MESRHLYICPDYGFTFMFAGAPAAVVLAGAPAAVVLAGAPAAVVLAGMAPPIAVGIEGDGGGAGPDGGGRTTPGMVCAMARC
jgi:hypothetical protein